MTLSTLVEAARSLIEAPIFMPKRHIEMTVKAAHALMQEADKQGVGEEYLSEWKKAHKAFNAALRRGKFHPDAARAMAASMRQMAEAFRNRAEDVYFEMMAMSQSFTHWADQGVELSP